MTAKERESRDEATKRARREKSWGKRIVRPPTNGRGIWLFTIRTT